MLSVDIYSILSIILYFDRHLRDALGGWEPLNLSSEGVILI